MTINEIINKVFKEETDNTFFQLIRYTVVGGVSFLVDFGTLAFCTEYFGIHYLVSAIIGFTLGLTTNYILSIVWVFHHRAISNKLFELLFFIIIGLIGLGFNELFIWILTDKVELHYLVSKIITTIIVYLWNFFARKYLLFNKQILIKQQ
tara:strand:- start:204 stop:653 length:450 start_codon:yes stop_codon:yes gene_type:complete